MAYDDQALVQKQIAQQREQVRAEFNRARGYEPHRLVASVVAGEEQALTAAATSEVVWLPPIDASHHASLVSDIQRTQLRNFAIGIRQPIPNPSPAPDLPSPSADRIAELKRRSHAFRVGQQVSKT